MISISLQQKKCIGCNYCAEIAPELFRMSKKDGKSVLLHATQKGDYQNLKTNDFFREDALKCKEVCPVKIIKVHDCKS